MILDNTQYQVTKQQIKRFEIALEELNKKHLKEEDSLLFVALRNGLQSQLDELREQIEEYKKKLENKMEFQDDKE